jgi:shikimate dehydrogenase
MPDEAPLGLPLPLSGATRVYAIVGDPIDQAGSPGLFNQAFRRVGAPAVLVPMQVAPADLPTLMATFRATRNWDGLVVTVPHKLAAVAMVDEVGPSGQRTGAVNAIRKDGDRLVGDNFDGIGFIEGLHAKGHDLRRRSVLLIGAGGAGRAVAHALADAAVDRIAIYDVDSTRASTLAAAVAASTGISASVAFNQDVRAYDLIVNCAPTGGKLEIDLAPARPETLVVDIVLKPAVTPLLAAAQSHGLKVHEGIHMLSGQVTALLAFFSLT